MERQHPTSWERSTEPLGWLKMGLNQVELSFDLCYKNCLLYSRPAEKFWVVTPQTPLKLLGKNLYGDHFWGRSEAGKVWPQAILGPGAMGLTGGLPLDLK